MEYIYELLRSRDIRENMGIRHLIYRMGEVPMPIPIHAYIHTYTHTHIHTYIHTYIQTYDGVTHTAYVTPKVARWRYSMGSPLFIHHNTIEYNSTHTPHIWKHGMVIVECPTSKDSCRVDRSSNPKRR